MNVGTADLTEIVWTLAAVPGLVLWLVNRVAAGRSRRAVRRLGVGNGRLVWARFSVLLTDVFVLIETVFVVVGISAMLRAPSPDSTTLSRLIVSVGFAGVSCLITFVGYRWRVVEAEILAGAQARRAQPKP